MSSPSPADSATPRPAIRSFLERGTWDRQAIIASTIQPERPVLTRWAAGNGALVVAGQQPALGGGPLYTLVKTAQAVAWARQWSTAECPLLPCFWDASDDHDLGEADHAEVITRSGRIARCRVDFGAARALRHVPARTGWAELMAHFDTHLGPGLGRDWVQAHAPNSSEDIGTWLQRVLIALFPDLLTVAAWRMRPLWRDALQRALESWPAQAIAQHRAAVRAHGGPDTLGDLEQPPCFQDLPTKRSALTLGECTTLFAQDPLAISPGAALRPVLQQAALPAAAVVLGPGERAYHALIEPLYAALELPKPQHLPRSTVTLMPGWWRRGCQAWGVDPAHFTRDMAAPEIPADPAFTVNQLDAALADLAARTVTGTAQRTRDASLARLNRERDRLVHSWQRIAHHQSGRPPWENLRTWAFPHGAGQDRSLSMLAAIWAFGPGIADEIVAAFPSHTLGSDIHLHC